MGGPDALVSSLPPPVHRGVEMTVDVQVAHLRFRPVPSEVFRERARPGDRHGVVSSHQDDLGAPFQALGHVVADVLLGELVVAGDVGHVSAVHDAEEGHQVHVVLEHVGEVRGGGFPDALRPARGAGAHDRAEIPGGPEEADLRAHLADPVPFGRAVGCAHEGHDAGGLERGVVAGRRPGVGVGLGLAVGTLVLVGHEGPRIVGAAQGWGLDGGCAVDTSRREGRFASTSPAPSPSAIETSCISRPVTTFGVACPHTGQRKL